MRGDITDAGHTNEQLKIELLNQWKLGAESRNLDRERELRIRKTTVFSFAPGTSPDLG